VATEKEAQEKQNIKTSGNTSEGSRRHPDVRLEPGIFGGDRGDGLTPEQAHEEADHTRTSSRGGGSHQNKLTCILRIFLRVSTTVSTISPDIGLGRWSCVLDRVTGAKDGGEGSEDGKMRI
jgi:hypothetical protein